MNSICVHDVTLYLDVCEQGDGTDIKAEVEYVTTPECKGMRGSYGEPLEPDYPAETEILGVFVKDNRGRRIDIEGLLTDQQMRVIQRQIEESYEPVY